MHVSGIALLVGNPTSLALRIRGFGCDLPMPALALATKAYGLRSSPR